MDKKKLALTMAVATTLTVSSVSGSLPTVVYAQENTNVIKNEENVAESGSEETILTGEDLLGEETTLQEENLTGEETTLPEEDLTGEETTLSEESMPVEENLPAADVESISDRKEAIEQEESKRLNLG